MHIVEKLSVWNLAVELSTEIYKLTSTFPKEELYGLTNQIRRCVVSIASNIAEGAGRNSNKEFNQFIGIANGSSFELSTQLLIAKNLNYIKFEQYETLKEKIVSIQKMNYKLQQSLLK